MYPFSCSKYSTNGIEEVQNAYFIKIIILKVDKKRVSNEKNVHISSQKPENYFSCSIYLLYFSLETYNFVHVICKVNDNTELNFGEIVTNFGSYFFFFN